MDNMPTRMATNFIRDDPHLKSEECQSADGAAARHMTTTLAKQLKLYSVLF